MNNEQIDYSNNKMSLQVYKHEEVIHSDNSLYNNPSLQANNIKRTEEFPNLNNLPITQMQENASDGMINIPNNKGNNNNDEFLNLSKYVLEIQRNEPSIRSMLFDASNGTQEFSKKQLTEENTHQFKSMLDATVFVQTLLRTNLAKKEYDEMKKIKKLNSQRTQVVMELYATEINYVSNLEIIVNCFMKPLRAIFDESKKGGITKENIDSIFCNIEDILVKHQDFLKKLKQIVDQWSSETLLSPLFENIHEYISTYIPYFNNYENSYDTIEKCMKVPTFEESIKMVEGVKKLERNDLKSLLILPVQRIPRYLLYLKEILKHTWATHPDYDGLRVEISKIDEDIRVLNRWKKFSETKGVFELLQSQIKRQNIEVKGKKYVSEGSVLFQYSSIKESLKAPLPTYIYLFNDMLLLTKTSVSKFTRIPRLSIIKSIPLTGIQIGDLSQTNDPEYQFFLSLTMQDHSILTLYFENIEQKEKWYDHFQRLLYHIHSEMSDLMTIGDDENSNSNSQILSMNGEEESGSPYKLNSALDKLKSGDEYYSEEDTIKSPDKKRDTTRKKKGKDKSSPDVKEKGFFSHMKNLFDEKISSDSIGSPIEKKLSKTNKKLKSKESLNINNEGGDTTIYSSYNSILNSDNEGSVKQGKKSKKISLHDTVFSSQYSIDKTDEDSTTSRARDNTETSSVITCDNSIIEEHLHNDIKNNEAIKEVDNETNEGNSAHYNSGRRNGQGNIIIDKDKLANNKMNDENNNNDNNKKERVSEIYIKEYDWVVSAHEENIPDNPISQTIKENPEKEKE